MDGLPRPIAPPETAGWVTVGGLDIQPARGVGTGAGVGWKGWMHKLRMMRIHAKTEKQKTAMEGSLMTHPMCTQRRENPSFW